MLATVSKDTTRNFHPSQWTANGCEAIVHFVRRWLRCHDNDEGRCLLTMDERVQPERHVLLPAQGSESRASISQVLRLVLLGRQLRVVRTEENLEQKRSSTGRLALRVGLPRLHLRWTSKGRGYLNMGER